MGTSLFTSVTPDELLGELFNAAYFPNQPIGRPIEGTRDTVPTFDHKTTVGFHAREFKVEETALVVETLTPDGSVKGAPDRFELKDGVFGKDEGDKRSVASEITADYIQFVPEVPGTSNSFRFERQPNNTWRAVLVWPAKLDKPARQKIYIMQPWKP